MTIFSEENKVSGNWMKWLKIGDKIEGTLVDKRTVFNKMSGKDQTVYEILKDDGEVWMVGGKAGIDAQTKYIQLGQIIGFEFVKEKESSVSGYSATKIIQVYSNPDAVNKEWLEKQEMKNIAESFGGEVDSSVSEPPMPDFSAPKSNPETEGEDETILDKINALAIEKLGAESDEDIKIKVMEATKLAFIEANYPQILEALEK